MDNRLYPSANQISPTPQLETAPIDSDMIEVIRGDSAQKYISLLNLFSEYSGSGLPTIPFTETAYTASGAITGVSCVALNKATVAKLEMTIAAPEPGWLLVIYQKDAGTLGHTVTLTAGTYNGTNKIATFNAQNKGLVLLGVSATRFLVVANVGTVVLSGT
jgi:hypothetical protein